MVPTSTAAARRQRGIDVRRTILACCALVSLVSGFRAAAETLRRCLSPDLGGYIARYGGLQAPVLFIRGDQDGVVDEGSARRFCGVVPHGRFLRIPECGHVPQEEKLDIVAAALADFLSL